MLFCIFIGENSSLRFIPRFCNKNCLENFSLTKNNILKKGGGMTDISKRLTRDFYKKESGKEFIK